MNTAVRETNQTEQFVAPAASVVEDGEGYLLQVEMPGVNKEGLEISTEGNELTITGRRSLPTALTNLMRFPGSYASSGFSETTNPDSEPAQR